MKDSGDLSLVLDSGTLCFIHSRKPESGVSLIDPLMELMLDLSVTLSAHLAGHGYFFSRFASFLSPEQCKEGKSGDF